MSQKSTVSQRIARDIHNQILRRTYQPGERLPTERALAVHYGVSRIPVREAIKILTQRGIIRTKHGSGNYVTNIDANKIAEQIYEYVMLCNTDLENIYAFWKILENYTATSAAEKRTPAELEQIKQLAADCAAEIRSALAGQPYNFNDAAYALHTAIAQTSRNKIVTDLVSAFHKSLLMRQERVNERPEMLAKFIGIHEALVRGIEKQDPEMTRRAMREDLNLRMDLPIDVNEEYKLSEISLTG